MRKVSLFAVLAIAVFAVACGGPATPEPVEFTVELSEFAFSPDTIEVQVGQEVTINLVNNGALEHEFMIGHDAMEMDGVVSMYTEDFFAVAGVDAPEIIGGADMEDMDHDDDEDMEDMEHDDEDEHGGTDHGFMVSVKTGETASFTFIVTEEMVGEWELGCFLDSGSHYTAGMVGALIVNP